MTSERIGGIKLNLETMSDAELVNLITYRIDVLERTANEVDRITGILRDRGMFTGKPEGTQQETVFEA